MTKKNLSKKAAASKKAATTKKAAGSSKEPKGKEPVPQKALIEETETKAPQGLKSAVRQLMKGITKQEQCDALKEQHFSWTDENGIRCEAAIVNCELHDFIEVRIYDGATKLWSDSLVRVEL